jgi:hypothetical protein
MEGHMKTLIALAFAAATLTAANAQTWPQQQQPLTVFVPNQPVQYPPPMQGPVWMPPMQQPQPQPFVSCYPIGGGIVSCQ